MTSLKTSYLGLELESPIIVGSCGLTKTPERVRKCAEAGAGAVVLKSLFEEQIRLDFAETTAAMAADMHPEAMQYLEADIAVQHGPRQYLEIIREATRAVSIPVIASVNCTGASAWVDFAQQIAAAGAAALELNLYVMPADPASPSADIERVYTDTVAAVRQKVSIPLAVKLAPYLTNVGRLAAELDKKGARGLVLFNRLYHPDIDVDKEAFKGGISLSSPGDHRRSLRWIAMLSGRVRADLCASGGVHEGRTVVKQILAGASAVQVVSALYKKGDLSDLVTMRESVRAWMEEKGYERLEDFRGQLSHATHPDAAQLERAQYIKAFVGVE
ncbi:MAG: dihydroorotate dehydrogenase-like protein [Polyangia bacterium]|jgi:dihydroorotate dehydrogenase (fumarate)|nr:dihydroorotate dehydrogenase-like protein [Polyangia bacterium]